jgi:hypothetical protein
MPDYFQALLRIEKDGIKKQIFSNTQLTDFLHCIASPEYLNWE